MKEQKKLKVEIQESNNQCNLNASPQGSLQVLIPNSTLQSALLIENTVKGPPGRSRSPGSDSDPTQLGRFRFLFY